MKYFVNGFHFVGKSLENNDSEFLGKLAPNLSMEGKELHGFGDKMASNSSSNWLKVWPSIHLDRRPRLHYFDKLPKKRKNCKDFGFSLPDPDLCFRNLPSHSDSAKYYKG